MERAYGSEDSLELYEKIKKMSVTLGSISSVVCGLTPYRKGKGSPKQTEKIVKEKAFDATYKKNKSYRQYLMGKDFHRYKWQIQSTRFISYGDWLAEPRYAASFDEKEKIIVRQTADKIIAHLDTKQFLNLKNVHNIKIINDTYSYKLLLGILNSKLLSWWYKILVPEQNRVFAEVKVVNLKKLPILNYAKIMTPAQKAQHDRMVQLVDQMLAAQKQLHRSKNDSDRRHYQQNRRYTGRADRRAGV